MKDDNDFISRVIDGIATRVLKSDKPLDLTPVETQILIGFGLGGTMREIATKLGLRSATDVSNRLHGVTRRTGVNKHRLMVYGAFLALSLGEQWPNSRS